MNYTGFDVIIVWYTWTGFFLWVVAQVTRADETRGILYNIACILLFVVAWPKILLTLCCLITRRLVIEGLFGVGRQ